MRRDVGLWRRRSSSFGSLYSVRRAAPELIGFGNPAGDAQDLVHGADGDVVGEDGGGADEVESGVGDDAFDGDGFSGEVVRDIGDAEVLEAGLDLAREGDGEAVVAGEVIAGDEVEDLVSGAIGKDGGSFADGVDLEADGEGGGVIVEVFFIEGGELGGGDDLRDLDPLERCPTDDE